MKLMNLTDLQIILLTIIAGILIILIKSVKNFLCPVSKESANEAEEDDPVPEVERKNSVPKVKGERVTKKSEKFKKEKEKAVNYTHPWLLTNLKGHSGRVEGIDLSPNGKYLASCSEDGTVLVWPSKLFKSKNHMPIRGNVQYDHADRIKWSPDGKAFLLHKSIGNELEVYKFSKKDEGSGYTITPSSVTFKVGHSIDEETIAIDMAANGKFIMTCSSKTAICLYNLKGDVQAKIETLQNNNYCAKISPDGRLVASSGFTSDVKVWEVKMSKSGEFSGTKRAFELTGHTSGVYSFDFNADSSKMATVSKDGTWKVFGTNIEYDRGQDASVISSGHHKIDKSMQDESSVILALSPDGKVIAFSEGRDIHMYNVASGEEVAVIENAHTEAITGLTFDQESKWLISSGDKHIRIFYNVPGLEANRADLKKELKGAKYDGLKDRLTQQIQQLDGVLSEIGVQC